MIISALLAFSTPASATVYTASYATGAEVPITASSFSAHGHSISLTLSYAPHVGTELMVVQNTGASVITSNFSNLPHGGTVALNYSGTNYYFLADYYGGTGNDLVLTWKYNRPYGWGDNYYGQIGNSTLTPSSVPVAVTNSGVLAGKVISQLAQGEHHTVALCTDGSVYTWGRNVSGQLGDGSYTGSNVPVAVSTSVPSDLYGGFKVVAIAAGEDFTLALRADGTVVGWGENGEGQLGVSDRTDRLYPTKILNYMYGSALYPNKKVVAIAAGRAHSVALCTDGTVVAWGRCGDGQLGNNDYGTFPYYNEHTPVQVNTDSGVSALYGKTVTKIVAARDSTLALCSDGTVVGWGDNGYGVLGTGGSGYPVPVAADASSGSALEGKTVTRISTSGTHSVALCSDGSIAAWGENAHGQLGNNSTTSSAVPVTMSAASGSALLGKTVVKISAGYRRSEAFCTDGTLAVAGELFAYGSTPNLLPTVAPTTSLATNEKFMDVSGTQGEALHRIIRVGTPAPSIPYAVVQYPAGTNIILNAPVDYGTRLSGASLTKVFTIKNTGTATLTGLAVTIDAGLGANAWAFTPGTPASTTLAPGASTTIPITFAASADSWAWVEVTSNADPMSFVVMGTTTSDFTPTFNTGTDIGYTTEALALSGQLANITLGHAPLPGASLMLVDVTGPAFITGSFYDLEHGDDIVLTYGGQSYHFVANYYGGNGNDLVLQWKGTRPMAWGDNAVGKLGDDSILDKYSPVSVINTGVLAGKTVLKVTSGGGHTLALLSDGSVAAWGENGSGQLGNGTVVDSDLPVSVSSSAFGGYKVVSIAAGFAHSLALCEDGKVYAWGYNASGQLGNNLLAVSSTPVAVNTASGLSALHGKSVSAIASSGNSYHSLALCSDGTLVAWGRNSIGCLGDGTIVTPRKVPVAIAAASSLNGKVVTSMATGLNFSIAVCADGSIFSWGENASSQLGDGGTVDRTSGPASMATTGFLPSGTYLRSISAGESHVVALRSDGRVVTWGSAVYDQTHHGSSVPSLVHTSDFVLQGRTVVGVSAGQHHSMAVCQDGYIASWGRNHTGQLGDGNILAKETLSMVSRESLRPGQGFAAVSAGQTHTLALLASPHEALTVEESPYDYLADDTGVANFGAFTTNVVKTFTLRNTGATLLTGLNVTLDGPHVSRFSKTVTSLANLAPGGSVSFNVTFTPSAADVGPKTAALHISSSMSGSLSSFDISLAGTSLGYYYPITYTSATQVPITASSIDGSDCSLSLSLNVAYPLAAGTQLMLVNHTGRDVISTDRQFQSFDQGKEVTLDCAGIRYLFVVDYYGGDGNDLVLRWQGAKGYAWGYNTFYGQVGDGTTTNRLLPTAILAAPGLLAGKTIVALEGGYYHSVALCSDGTVYAWGDNSAGQLGNNSASAGPFTSPVQVHNTTGPLLNRKVVAISSAGYHTLALCQDGTLVAWGNNSWGELGDNTLTVRRLPTLVNTAGVLNGKRVAKLAAGGTWSMVLCTDGTLSAWGSNFGGYVGVGYWTVPDFKLPILVDTSTRSALHARSIRSISAGGAHNLVRCSDGSLLSWGDDVDQQLGNGSPTGSRFGPILVNADAGVSALHGQTLTQISAGASHSLVASTSGQLFAWGNNVGGSVGDNTFTSRDVAVPVNKDYGVSALYGKTVVKIGTGASTSYALCSDGSLAMWGYNGAGQLGINSTINQSVPVLVSTSTLGYGSQFCGIPAFGWSTSYGIVGSPQPMPRLVELATPYNISFLDDDLTDGYEQSGPDFGSIYMAPNVITNITSRQKTFILENLGTGYVDNVVITKGGTNPDMFSVSAVTLDVYGRPTFTVTYAPTMAASHKATLSIASNGSSTYGIVGIILRGTAGTTRVDAVYTTGHEAPLITTVPFTATGKSLQAVLNHEPVAGRDLMVVNNQSNAAISGTFSYLDHGGAISLWYGSSYGSYVINYYGGDGNDIVLVWRDNAAYSWGVNTDGQLGNSTTSSTPTTLPSVVYDSSPPLLDDKTILSTATGGGHTLVLCSNGKVYAWGDNQFGQLGNGSIADSSVPVAIDESSGLLYNKRVLAIAAGKHHSMALYVNTAVTPNVISVATWGSNGSGQLGINISPTTTPYSMVPVAVHNTASTSALYGASAPENVYAIAAGENHCLAMYHDSNSGAITTIATWGDNTHRQLGNNSAAAYSQTPVAVTLTSGAFATLKNSLSIAAGSNHCLAIRSDGTVVTWGRNDQGQGGTGSTSSYLAIPTSISTSGILIGKTVRAIAGGSNHSLALCSDNSIAAWGDNADGQLGNGSTLDSSSPVLVTNSLDFQAKRISAGDNRSFALHYNQAIMTWGDNDGGRLGDNNYDSMLGLYPDALIPVELDETVLGYNDAFSELPKGPTAQHGVIIVPRGW